MSGDVYLVLSWLFVYWNIVIGASGDSGASGASGIFGLQQLVNCYNAWGLQVSCSVATYYLHFEGKRTLVGYSLLIIN